MVTFISHFCQPGKCKWTWNHRPISFHLAVAALALPPFIIDDGINIEAVWFQPVMGPATSQRKFTMEDMHAHQNATLPGQVARMMMHSSAPSPAPCLPQTPPLMPPQENESNIEKSEGSQKCRPTCSDFGVYRKTAYQGYFFCSHCVFWDNELKISVHCNRMSKSVCLSCKSQKFCLSNGQAEELPCQKFCCSWR